ncbi:MAG: peptidoglycan recognition family protein [Deltaproteobacteria bacterium]
MGCAVDRSAPANVVPVGGDSPLAALFVRAAADAGIPADELAAASWARTRFQYATDPDAAIRADAAQIRAGGVAALEARGGDGLAREVDAALARGISGVDADGRRVIVTRRALGGDGFGQISQGLDYTGATWVAASTSNYQVASRGAGTIDHIVIHDTEGSFSGSVSWFQDPTARVSAHYIVRSSDGHIDQMVAEKNVAWHDACFNTNTIGIEHEGYEASPKQWFTEAMYEKSAALTAYLADKYGIAKEHGPILGHGEAPDCSTHTDPGAGWNWEHYIELVKAGGAGQYLAGDITVDAPATIASGELATVTVTAANHGTSAWDLDATRVGTQSPQDRDSQLYVAGAWIAPNRAAAVDAPTAAGATGTFTFQIVGPVVTEPTRIDETFELVEEGGSYFGPTFDLAIQVVPAEGGSGMGTTADQSGCNAGGGGAGALVLLAFAGARRRRR